MPARHDLAWLSSAGWEAAKFAARPDQRGHLMRWCAAGWPTTVRRPDADAAPGEICLGITLLPADNAGERLRLGLRCSEAYVTQLRRPLELSKAAPALPQRWQEAYHALEQRAAIANLNLHVYGSLALQALTGQPYLTMRSDIDLAFFPVDAAQLAGGLALLEDCGRHLPLDGEIVFPTGRAVAWKEWRNAMADQGRTRVMAKSMEGVALLAPRELLDELMESTCWR